MHPDPWSPIPEPEGEGEDGRRPGPIPNEYGPIDMDRLARAAALAGVIETLIDQRGGLPDGTMAMYLVCHNSCVTEAGARLKPGDILIDVRRHAHDRGYEFVVDTPEDPCSDSNIDSIYGLIDAIYSKALHLRETECPCN